MPDADGFDPLSVPNPGRDQLLKEEGTGDRSTRASFRGLSDQQRRELLEVQN